MERQLFEKWLKDNTELAEGTIISYGSAITAISKWAVKQKIIQQNIYDINHIYALNEVLNLLNASEIYNEKNITSNRRWSSALTLYKQFLKNRLTVDENRINDFMEQYGMQDVYLKDEFEHWMSSKSKVMGKHIRNIHKKDMYMLL